MAGLKFALARFHLLFAGMAFFFVSLMVAEQDMAVRALLVVPTILSFFFSLALYSYEHSKSLEGFKPHPAQPARPSSSSAVQKG